MSYIKSVLQPGEKIIMIGRLHWIIFHRAIFYVLVGAALVAIEMTYWPQDAVKGWAVIATGVLFGVLFAVSAIHAAFIRWITEIAVTDRRVLYKRGFINRHTIETNMDKVASVDVDQSILGRLLNYGTVTVRGTGVSFEPLRRIEAPLALRNAIIVK
jgi:uncharacterized membrane protein YdbT with pleckstrin-like domain